MVLPTALEVRMNRRSWKPYLLALVLVAGAAAGFFVAPAEAARCSDLKVCCSTDNGPVCMSCYATPWGCQCPTITCPP